MVPLRLRRLVYDWTPPAMVPLLRRMRRPLSTTRRLPEWPAGAEANWNHPSIAATEIEKWTRFLELTSGAQPLGINHELPRLGNLDPAAHNVTMSFAYSAAVAISGRQAISVLDWGGGLGHYARLLRVLFPAVDFDYQCHDLPEICELGRSVQPQVVYSSAPGAWEDRRYDFVLASGSLQAVRDWQRQLAQLARATRGHLLLGRTPVSESKSSFVIAQRPRGLGYNTELVSWVFDRGELLTVAAEAGLELIREFVLHDFEPVSGVRERPAVRAYLFRPVAE
jgi:putative methyltransferase (TIGR04325 family)